MNTVISFDTFLDTECLTGMRIEFGGRMLGFWRWGCSNLLYKDIRWLALQWDILSTKYTKSTKKKFPCFSCFSWKKYL